MVKEEAFGAELDALAKFMGWGKDRALGKLVLLWRGSQAAKARNATLEQICVWADCQDLDEARKFVETMIHPTCRWLKRISLDTYEIVGNRKELKKMREWKRSGRNGNDKVREKWGRGNPKSGAGLNAGANAGPIATPIAGALSLPFPSSPVHTSPVPSSPAKTGEEEPHGSPGQGMNPQIATILARAIGKQKAMPKGAS